MGVGVSLHWGGGDLRQLKKEEIGRVRGRLFEREACLKSLPRGLALINRRALHDNLGAYSRKCGIWIGIWNPKTLSSISVSLFTWYLHGYIHDLSNTEQGSIILAFRKQPSLLAPRPEGDTWVNFCWVCAAGLSEPLPQYSLFCGQL